MPAPPPMPRGFASHSLERKFFCGFLQQFSFADPTDSPNTQDWLFGPYVVHPVGLGKAAQ